MAEEVPIKEPLTDTFCKRRDSERQKLHGYLHVQLQQDISRAFVNSLYCNLELTFGTTSIYTHRSIIQSRALKFYSKYCCPNEPAVHTISFHESSAEHIIAFISNLYTKCNIEEDENHVISFLESLQNIDESSIFHGSCDSEISPDSEAYHTPRCSPSDVIPNLEEPVASRLHDINRSYYSIVPVDELAEELWRTVSDSPKKVSNLEDSLEKELAEQDELIKSFESIKSKEVTINHHHKKIAKPTSLPFISNHNSKRKKLICDQKFGCDVIIKKDQKTRIPKLLPEISTPQDSSVNEKCVEKNITASKISPYALCKNFNQKISFDYTCSYVFDIKVNNEDDIHGCKFFGKTESDVGITVLKESNVECNDYENLDLAATEEFLSLPCSPEMDGSATGPDSGIDTCSTGYLPGVGLNSPREQTVSETSGIDLISDEMPRDDECEKENSCTSSPVNSEICNWESSICPSAQFISDNTFEESLQLNHLSPEIKPLNIACNDVPAFHNNVSETDNDWCEIENGMLSLNIPTEEVEHFVRNLEQDREAANENERMKIMLDSELSLDSTKPIMLKKIDCTSNFFINAADLSDEMEIKPSHQLPILEEQKSPNSEIKNSCSKTCDENISQNISLSESVCCRPNCDIVTKGLPDFLCKNNASLQDCLPAESQIEALSEDLISLANPNSAIQSIKNQLIAADTSSQASSVLEVLCNKMIPSKISILKSEQKLSSLEDHTEKFEKEIYVTERLEPWRESRKISSFRTKSESSVDDIHPLYATEDKMSKRNGITESTESFELNETYFASENSNSDERFLSDEIQTNIHPKTHIKNTCSTMNGDLIDLSEEQNMKNNLTSSSDSDVDRKNNQEIYIDNDNCDNIQNFQSKFDDRISPHDMDSVNLLALPVDKSSTSSSSHPDSEQSLETDSKHETETSEVSAEEDVPRRASLIRRNTFELDPDDDKLALLRQEYEKRQGNLLFQNCIPQFSGHAVGEEASFRESSSRDVLQPMSLPNIPPHSVNGPTKSPHLLSHLVNQDLDTPDSLNNDNPMDTIFADHNDLKMGTTNSTCSNDHNALLNGIIADNGNLEDSSQASKNNEDVAHSYGSSYDNSFRPVVSGALTCDDIVVDEKRYDSLKRQKRTESTPIVSGGAIPSDFASPVHSKKESPIMTRRRNEMAPIISGGATFDLSPPQPEVKPQVKECTSLNSAWVVDMSDCSPSNTKNVSDFKKQRKSEANHSDSSTPSKHEGNSLQFFIDLSDEQHTKSFSKDRKHLINTAEKLQKSATSSADLSKSESTLCNAATREDMLRRKSTSHTENCAITSVDPPNSAKKNAMFSMFIDIGNDKEKTQDSSSREKPPVKKKLFSDKHSPSFAKRDLVSHLKEKPFSFRRSASNDDDNTEATNNKSSSDLQASDVTGITKSASHSDMKDMKHEKKGFYMFVETDSPVPRRKTLPSGPKPPVNRHSWNSDAVADKTPDQLRPRQDKFHKRAHSLSVDRNMILSCPDESSLGSTGKIQATRKSHKSLASGTPPQDDNSSSNTSNETGKRILKQSSSVSEDGSVSSVKHNSKSSSTKISTDSATEKEAVTQESSSSTEEVKINGEDISECEIKTDTEMRNEGDIENQTILSDEQISVPAAVQEESCSLSFVKLSDLDKQIPKPTVDTNEDILSNFSSNNRMTRSIPETSWIENKLLMTRSIGSTSSSRSLNRLFPHLHSASTTSSSPTSLARSKSPEGEDGDNQTSETSDLSSMQSSMGPSGLDGSTEETDASSSYMNRSGPVSRLGEDLLRMFLEEINTDVTVDVGGRKLKAHKCILSSRCQYFAAILSGGWVESAGNVISLQGFSYNAVHFALCHIYSGTSNIPDTISIVELATLADMLGLEGLKEVIMYTLKVKYCHFFHKPCTMCAVGVVECLPLAAAYGLDEIYRKSLRWITKHFVRIWPTKGFASLPRELIEKCYQQHVIHMTVDNVLDTIMNCDKLLATLPNVRWAEPVLGITSQLLESSIKFLANNFSGVLGSDSFQSLGKDLSWNISRLEDSLVAATDRLPPEQACQSYPHLHKCLNPDPDSQIPHQRWSQSYMELLRRLQKRVEASLIRQAPRAARCPSWPHLDPAIRKKVQEAACLVILPGEELHRLQQQKQSSSDRGHHGGSRSSSRCLDLRQVKLAMAQQARRMASGGRVTSLQADSRSAVRQQGHRKQKSEPPPVQKTTEKSETSKKDEQLVRPKTWPMRVLESKARPLKQTVPQGGSTCTPDKSNSSTKRSGKNLISSSDSSRTSSPAMKRAGVGRSQTPASKSRKKPGESDPLPDKTSSTTTSKSCLSTRPETPSMRRKFNKDDTAISTDSLSEGMINGDKAPSSAPGRILGNARPATPPTKGRGRQPLGRLTLEGTMSSDSLANTDSSVHDKADVKVNTKSPKFSRSQTSKVISNENQHRSPSARRATLRQVSCSPRDSPIAKVRMANTPTSSPIVRRNTAALVKSPTESTLSSGRVTKGNKAVSSPTPSSRRMPVKSQCRSQNTHTPSKTMTESPKLSENRSSVLSRQTARSTGTSAKVNSLRKSAAPCSPIATRAKSDTAPSAENKPPSVGSRSGTFLKDEPTILKIPKIADVSE